MRKEFQRARTGEKSKHSGKLYWGEGKCCVLRDVEGSQALVATAPRPLRTLHMFSWFWGRSRLAFTLPNLPPGFSQACAGLSPKGIPFLGPLGFHALIQSNPFPRFSCPFMWPFWLPLPMPQSSVAPSGFYCTCAEQRNFPCCSDPSLGNPS